MAQTQETSERIDSQLLDRFTHDILEEVPHSTSNGMVLKPTPLLEITPLFVKCAKQHFGIDLSRKNVVVFCKFDSEIYGGSVKVRPAVRIIENAIRTGQLRTGQTIFEATSGNFGLALGILGKLGLNVVVLVSRKLQGGVIEELRNENVHSIYLDVDICPAPGAIATSNMVVAKAAAANLRQQLGELGFDEGRFNAVIYEIESLLGKQDAISLAKFLAKVYDGFCPQQYDNILNPNVHTEVTGPEIDQQLGELAKSLDEFKILVTFGTGGTATGLSKYVWDKYQAKNVHVIFPLASQDVAGIRTKEKASGLRFYQSNLYAGEHEVDFEPARKILKFFVDHGQNIGESSALALYGCLQMINYGIGEKFVVLAADGISKYLQQADLRGEADTVLEVTPEQANLNHDEYGNVVWTHSMFAPKHEGIELVASSLGLSPHRVKIARARDVQEFLSTTVVPSEMQQYFKNGRTLLVCMAGNTSLRIAELLTEKGIPAQSLTGGIMGLSQTSGKSPETLVQVATE